MRSGEHLYLFYIPGRAGWRAAAFRWISGALNNAISAVRARHAGCVRRRVAQCDLMFTLLFNNETQARAWGFITMPINSGNEHFRKNVTQIFSFGNFVVGKFILILPVLHMRM
jgi:hypothetical protein